MAKHNCDNCRCNGDECHLDTANDDSGGTNGEIDDAHWPNPDIVGPDPLPVSPDQ